MRTGTGELERDIQSEIWKALCGVDGYRALVLWRNSVGVMESPDRKRVFRFGVGGKGGADLIGIYKGRFVAAEVKSRVGRQTPEQKLFQHLVLSKGGSYAVLRSVDDAHAWIARLDQQHQQPNTSAAESHAQR